MSKCNLKYPGECVNVNPQSRVCEIDHPCEHKSAPVTCPVCGKALVREADGELVCYESFGGCGEWTQPDDEPRPKRPAPREGYHAGEWRRPKENDRYFDEYGMIIVCLSDHPEGSKSWWIAVPDEPAFVETAVGEFQPVPGPEKPSAADKRDGLKRKYNIARADGTAVDRDAEYFVLRLDYHDGCDTAHVHSCRAAVLCYATNIQDHLPKLSEDLFKKYGHPAPEPVPVVPVARYWQSRFNPSCVFKTVDGLVTEHPVLHFNATPLSAYGKLDIKEITPAEYAAAKSPDHIRGVTEMVRAIEPLDPMAGTLERTEKLNEIVAWSSVVTKWINAKGGA